MSSTALYNVDPAHQERMVDFYVSELPCAVEEVGGKIFPDGACVGCGRCALLNEVVTVQSDGGIAVTVAGRCHLPRDSQ